MLTKYTTTRVESSPTGETCSICGKSPIYSWVVTEDGRKVCTNCQSKNEGDTNGTGGQVPDSA
jgi:formylmethanofuran dehydrogenase subunit E